MQVWPSDKHNVKVFYETLLPFLQSRPLAATQVFAQLQFTPYSQILNLRTLRARIIYGELRRSN